MYNYPEVPQISEPFTYDDNRPERVVTLIKVEDLLNPVDPEQIYCNILTSCIFRKHEGQPTAESDAQMMAQAKRCIDWLKSTDFFTAPGSTKYHDSEPQGLVRHSLRVVHAIRELVYGVEMFRPTDESADAYASPVLVALVHDWCKIGLYEKFMRNVKNDETGKWESVPSYRRAEDLKIPMGHGDSSMWMAQKFFKLSLEECLAIRWHMGRWYVSDSEIDQLQFSNENYPLVHLLQFADQLAITKYLR